MTVRGKAMLVTGANRGIGQALVDEALRRGAHRVYAASWSRSPTMTIGSRPWSWT